MDGVRASDDYLALLGKERMAALSLKCHVLSERRIMAAEKKPYTMAELMVTAAAREIADGEVVFVGMRLPLLGFLLAKSTHAPGATGIF